MAQKKSNKRLNYFTGQLLDADDFRDEQEYHIGSLRSHNRNLHTWGVARGLNVEKTGTKNVTLSTGMAIDSLGRQIIVDQMKEIDLSASTAPTLYLTISYREQETDFKEEGGEKGSTRITEEAVIEHDQNKPDEQSLKIILAKLIFDREKDTLESIDVEDRTLSGNVGGDIEAHSIVFSMPEDPASWPMVHGVTGPKPGLEIRSENTILKGNLDVSGTLSGTLDRDIVGTDQIAQGSVSISKMHTIPRSGSAEIGPKSEAKVEFTEPSADHRFFITSVIPITPDSDIEWKWHVEKEKDQFSYVLVVKNLTNKKIEIEFKYYEIL
jgi:hypothetical protein